MEVWYFLLWLYAGSNIYLLIKQIYVATQLHMVTLGGLQQPQHSNPEYKPVPHPPQQPTQSN